MRDMISTGFMLCRRSVGYRLWGLGEHMCDEMRCSWLTAEGKSVDCGDGDGGRRLRYFVSHMMASLAL